MAGYWTVMAGYRWLQEVDGDYWVVADDSCF